MQDVARSGTGSAPDRKRINNRGPWNSDADERVSPAPEGDRGKTWLRAGCCHAGRRPVRRAWKVRVACVRVRSNCAASCSHSSRCCVRWQLLYLMQREAGAGWRSDTPAGGLQVVHVADCESPWLPAQHRMLVQRRASESERTTSDHNEHRPNKQPARTDSHKSSFVHPEGGLEISEFSGV